MTVEGRGGIINGGWVSGSRPLVFAQPDRDRGNPIRTYVCPRDTCSWFGYQSFGVPQSPPPKCGTGVGTYGRWADVGTQGYVAPGLSSTGIINYTVAVFRDTDDDPSPLGPADLSSPECQLVHEANHPPACLDHEDGNGTRPVCPKARLLIGLVCAPPGRRLRINVTAINGAGLEGSAEAAEPFVIDDTPPVARPRQGLLFQRDITRVVLGGLEGLQQAFVDPECTEVVLCSRLTRWQHLPLSR